MNILFHTFLNEIFSTEIHMDYNSEVNFNRNVLKYLRLKEEYQLRQSKQKSKIKTKANSSNVDKNEHIKMHVKEQLINKYDHIWDSCVDDEEDLITDEYEKEQSRNDSKQNGSERLQMEVEGPVSYGVVWHQLLDDMIELKCMENINQYVIKYTNILKMHIDNKIHIDNLCIVAIVSCIRPSYIEDIFDLGLIDTQTNISCLFDHNLLFDAFGSYLYTSESVVPYYLIMTLSVFLYKVKCLPYKTQIMATTFKKLVEMFTIKSKRYSSDFKNVGLKHFIKCCILNGLFTSYSFNKFIAIISLKKSKRYQTSPSSSSSASSLTSDDSIDSFYEAYRHHIHRFQHSNNDTFDDTSLDEDEESISSMDTNDQVVSLGLLALAQTDNQNNIFIDHNNNNNQNNVINNQNSQPASTNIREIPHYLDELRKCFPLTLKNLARIRIKQSMNNYNKENVLEFRILPDVLKQFVCFKDEIDSIKRLTERNHDNDVDTENENCMDFTFL